MFSGISHVRKALAAGWRWGFTHRNPTLAGILAGETMWAAWWHPCMSQMMDNDDWVSTITNINTIQKLQRVHRKPQQRVNYNTYNTLFFSCLEERSHVRSSAVYSCCGAVLHTVSATQHIHPHTRCFCSVNIQEVPGVSTSHQCII